MPESLGRRIPAPSGRGVRQTENPPNEEWIQELFRKTAAAAISVETLATLAMKSQRGESRALSIQIGDAGGSTTEPKK